MKGIRTIDCMVGLNPGGQAGGGMIGDMVREGWLRDADSAQYHHPAQHLFKDAPARMEHGQSVEEVLALMDEVGVEMGLLGLNINNPKPSLDVIEKYPQRFFGEVGVNPFLGMPEIRKLERLVREHPGIKACSVTGFRIQKPYNDKIYYPLYAKCVELDIPVIMYVGLPGPRVPGEIQNPMYLDEILWFFPELKIVMRHGGEPWEFTCVKLMLKWPNLYYSTSAFAPSHIPKDIVDYMNKRGPDRVIYAGYYPGLDFRRLKREIEDLPLRDHVWPLFLRENALRVFKLGQAGK